jgi:hypothetical protein
MSELAVEGVEWGETYLEVPGGISYDEWARLGETLQRMQRSVNWWLGDWIRFGEAKFGEKYTQAIETTGRSYDGLRNCVYVAERVDMGRRRSELSWSHHQEVAALAPIEQTQWLRRAVDDGLSTRQLRGHIKEQRLLPETASPQWSGLREAAAEAERQAPCPTCGGRGWVDAG